VLIHENRDKLEAKTWKGTFVGYDTQSKSYLVFNSKTNKVTRASHLTFEEDGKGDEDPEQLKNILTAEPEHKTTDDIEHKSEDTDSSTSIAKDKDEWITLDQLRDKVSLHTKKQLTSELTGKCWTEAPRKNF
jgi:hypothetical protein